jgi:hypothetical protein
VQFAFVCGFFVFPINEDLDARRIKSRSGTQSTRTAALPTLDNISQG